MVKMVNFMLYILLRNKNNWGGEIQDSWSMPMPRYRSLPTVDTVLPPEQASPQALTAVWTLYNRIPEWRQITTTTHNSMDKSHRYHTEWNEPDPKGIHQSNLLKKDLPFPLLLSYCFYFHGLVRGLFSLFQCYSLPWANAIL